MSEPTEIRATLTAKGWVTDPPGYESHVASMFQDHLDQLEPKAMTVSVGFEPASKRLTEMRNEPTSRAIAALNAALPDSDPRKITREKLALLRHAAGGPTYIAELADIEAMRAFLDALESYLPAPVNGG